MAPATGNRHKVPFQSFELDIMSIKIAVCYTDLNYHATSASYCKCIHVITDLTPGPMKMQFVFRHKVICPLFCVIDRANQILEKHCDKVFEVIRAAFNMLKDPNRAIINGSLSCVIKYPWKVGNDNVL